jgi:hypothetical protein
MTRSAIAGLIRASAKGGLIRASSSDCKLLEFFLDDAVCVCRPFVWYGCTLYAPMHENKSRLGWRSIKPRPPMLPCSHAPMLPCMRLPSAGSFPSHPSYAQKVRTRTTPSSARALRGGVDYHMPCGDHIGTLPVGDRTCGTELRGGLRGKRRGMRGSSCGNGRRTRLKR